MRDAMTLFCQKSIDGRAKIFCRNPVVRPGGDGFKAPLNLVLALGSAIKPLQTLRDGKINALVVAGFEM